MRVGVGMDKGQGEEEAGNSSLLLHFKWPNVSFNNYFLKF